MKFFSLRRLAYVVGGWGFLILIMYAKIVVGGHPSIWTLHYASEYGVWALFALVLYPLVASTPFTLKNWLRRFPVLLVIWHVGGALAHTAGQVAQKSVINDPSQQISVAEVVSSELPHQLSVVQYMHVADFLGLLALCVILVLIRNSRVREIEQSKLKAQLADARLNSLRAQMHPHFLFNTLNTVATLATTDSKGAVEVLSRLSDILRRASASDEGHFTTIKEEFELTRSFITIMQHRFGDRVSVEIDCDPRIESALIPVLTLQPLVENAYQHGVGPRLSGGHIEVRGILSGECIEVSVCDDGLGENAGPNENGQGMALKNIRDRLQHLYDGQATLETSIRAEGGYCAVLTIPYQGPEDLE